MHVHWMNSKHALRLCRFTAPKGLTLSSLAAAGHMVAAGAEGCICFWDQRSGEQLACFDDTHPESVTQVRVTRLFCSG